MRQEERQYRQIKKIINANEGVSLHDKKGSQFHFPLYLTERLKETTIETLELSTRSYNGLRRAGFRTVGELAKALNDGMDLKKIRSCGSRSVEEIMESLFILNYESLDPEERDDYLIEVIKMNVY